MMSFSCVMEPSMLPGLSEVHPVSKFTDEMTHL